jgi:hypothetical protein
MNQPTETAMPKRLASRVRNWLTQIADPAWAIQGLAGYARCFLDWRRYQEMPGAKPIHWADAYPQVHDHTSTSPFDAHYFYVSGWAMRRIVAQHSVRHIDIGSQTVFASLLGAVMPVTVVDYRPLRANLSNLACLRADILHLPLGNSSVESLSRLHVAEHIGLGRYGDPLNPHDTHQATRELARSITQKCW